MAWSFSLAAVPDRYRRRESPSRAGCRQPRAFAAAPLASASARLSAPPCSPLCGALHQFSADIVPIQRNSGQPVPGTHRFARVRVITLTLLVVFISPAPAAAAWRLPVSGPVSRAFAVGSNPYAGGHHRGVDLSAPPGSAVRAPCAGRVLVAGRVGSSGGVVTRAVRALEGDAVAPLNNFCASRRFGQRGDLGRHARAVWGPRRPPSRRAARRRPVRLRRPTSLPRAIAAGSPAARPRPTRPPARPGGRAARRPVDASPRARAVAAPPSRAVARVGRSRARAGRPRLSLALAPVARTAAGWGGGGVGRCVSLAPFAPVWVQKAPGRFEPRRPAVLRRR